MKARSLRIIRTNAYTVHELQSPTGMTIREYYAPGGMVFGVAWEGPWPPDMRQLLGSYFEQFRRANEAARSTRKTRGVLVVNDGGLVVRITGHARAFSGFAYAPGLLPTGRPAGRYPIRTARVSNPPLRHPAGRAGVVADDATRPRLGRLQFEHLQNVLSVVVNGGPTNNALNQLFASVTVCVPGTSNCQTIGGILVDTGSVGLADSFERVDGCRCRSKPARGGAPLVECLPFLDGFTWGPVHTADVKMAGEQHGHCRSR